MKALFLDLDGTMYRGNKMMEGGRELMEALRENQQRYLFLTNNSKRTRRQNAEHMESMGYLGIRKYDFFTSAMAAAIYVRKNYDKRKVFMIGEEGLREALLEQGFLFDDENPDFVFVGLDQKANYQKYSQAVNALKNGAILIGTNEDRVLAQEDGFVLGNGSVVAMMEYASNQKSPKIGKPHAPILAEALESIGLQKHEVLLVGDNLETDILLGKQCGVETVLVLGGVHDEADCERLGIYPDHIVKNLNQLRVEFCLQKCY
ncbi:MAG: HAD-IIA family hydrolase [Erysipelotrichaceae bacterium]|nr:HAD-IIA family hydrolase [Erysipelotrichaceae bacterium]